MLDAVIAAVTAAGTFKRTLYRKSERKTKPADRIASYSSAVSVRRRYQQKYYSDPKQRPRQPAQDFPRHKTHRRSSARGRTRERILGQKLAGLNPWNFPERLNFRPKLSRAASAIEAWRRCLQRLQASLPKTQEPASLRNLISPSEAACRNHPARGRMIYA
jgi:hypothetical protein